VRSPRRVSVYDKVRTFWSRPTARIRLRSASSCSFCIQSTSSTSSRLIVFTLIYMPTIHRDLVALTLSTRSSPLCQIALMTCLTGCDRIGCSYNKHLEDRDTVCSTSRRRHLLPTTAVRVGVADAIPTICSHDDPVHL